MNLLRFFIVVALYCSAAHLSCATLAEYESDGNTLLKNSKNLLTEVYDATLIHGADASTECIADYARAQGVCVKKTAALYNAIRLYKEFLALCGHIDLTADMPHVQRQRLVLSLSQKDIYGVRAVEYYHHCHGLTHLMQEDTYAVAHAKNFCETQTYRVFYSQKILPEMMKVVDAESAMEVDLQTETDVLCNALKKL